MSRRDAVGVALAAGLLAGCGRGAEPRVARDVRAGASVTALPAPVTAGPVSLEAALSRRRSVRVFTGQALTAAEIGQLLWAAQGVTHDGDRRTAPSAGALYPLEVYAVTGDAVLRYLPAGHRAERWASSGTPALLADATPSREAVAAAPAIFVITEVVARTAAKYGARAPTYADLEVGHAAQNLALQAVALGLGAVTIGALDGGRVVAALGLADRETPRYLIPVGHPGP